MKANRHIEVALRAAILAKTILGLLEECGVHSARLQLAEAARQFNELNSILKSVEKEDGHAQVS